MEPRACPRCGNRVVPSGRGRPPVWCSADCRRAASEERRVARDSKQPIEIREEIRVKEVPRSYPLSPGGAVDRVLGNERATRDLLRILAYRWRQDPPKEPEWNPEARLLVQELWRAYHGAGSGDPAPPMPSVDPAAAKDRATELQAATDLVLGSPRAVREILRHLTETARAGGLQSGEHTATVTAADSLYTALVVSRTLRPRR